MNDPTLNNQLKNQDNIKVIGRDLQYKEAILEITEINIVDILILKENIPGNIDIEELLKKIKEKNKNIKIIIILEKEKENIEKLKYKYNLKIYYKNKINIKKLIEIIINKKEIRNNYCNIITVEGGGEKQKLNLAYIIAKTIKINNKKNKYNKNYKIRKINKKIINKIIKKKVLKINLEEIKINKKQICQEIFYIRYKKIIM